MLQFRRSVDDILNENHDDYFLLRWLRARNWNPSAAEKMLRESMKWRERWGADDIENWETPEICEKYCPMGVSGFDLEGSPVIIVPFAGIDIWGLLHTVPRTDLIRVTMKLLEKNMKVAFENSKAHGYRSRQLTVIFDMDKFNLKQYLWRPAGETVISLIKMYEANYPEILKTCYIINAPKMFAFGFNIIKKFLDEYTLSKIMIFKADQKKWLPQILDRVDKSQLPLYYGGTLVGVNGDPKCQDKIVWGGKIPIECYTNLDETKDESFVEATIKKGTKLKLEFECKDVGCFLK